MAEIRYVDWDGLIYYDGKIKDYVDDKIRESLKFKGDVTYEELLQISPSYDNVNTAFRITEEFTTNDWFKNPGYGYSAYTIVFVTQLEDGTFKYDILLEPNGSGNGTDLTNYYTKEDVDGIVAELPTKDFVEKTVIDAIDSIEIDITGLVTKEEFDVVQQQSASNNVKILQLDEEIIDINQRIDNITTPDLTGYATKEYVAEQIDSIEIPSTDGLATETFVHEMIAKAELEDKEADLEAYYTKDQVDALIPDVSNLATKEEIADFATEQYVVDRINEIDIPDVSNFITEIPAEYITEDELDKKGYLTEHQDLSDYATKDDIANFATKEELQNAIDNIEHPTVDLTGYATETYVDNKFAEIKVPTKLSELDNDAGYITAENIPDTSNFVTMEDVEAKGYLNNIPDEYVTSDELAAEGFIKEHQSLEEYAKKTDIPSLDGYATEQYVENAISNIDFPDIDTSTIATKEELTTALSDKANDVLFTDDYRVGTPIGQFVADETVQNMTLSQIITKLLGLTAYVPPTTDLPEGTTTTVENIIVKEVPIMILGNNGEPSSDEFEYKTMTTAEGALDSQNNSFMYQIVDADNKVVESGYQTVTEELDEGYLTVYLPTSVTAFSVRIFDGISGAWVTPEWQMIENADYKLDGYIAYTADPAYDIYEKMTIRIVIEN